MYDGEIGVCLTTGQMRVGLHSSGTLWDHCKVFRPDGASGVAIVSDNNPGKSVDPGSLWFDTSSFCTYIYYDYGNAGQGQWFPITVPLVDDPSYQTMKADQQRFIAFTKAQYVEAQDRIEIIEKNQQRIDEVWDFLQGGGFDPEAIEDLQQQINEIKDDIIPDGDQAVIDALLPRIEKLESELDNFEGQMADDLARN